MSAFPENIPLCFFPPHCFITAGHFPALSWRDQRGCIDIHLSLSFMKGKSFTRKKKRHCFFPILFVPPSPPFLTPHHPSSPTPTPLQSFHFYLRKRKWMSVCASVLSALACLKLDAWKLPPLCELNSRWAGVWVCVCVCRVKGP